MTRERKTVVDQNESEKKNTITVILKGAESYQFSGYRFLRGVPQIVDKSLASLFKNKGWFLVQQ
jgi:hypothetical protein